MENQIQVNSIGDIQYENENHFIRVKKKFREGLKNIQGFSHLQIVWWGSLVEKVEDRARLITKKPYRNSPAELGVFATRSQYRPNPILITTIYVSEVDLKNGLIYTPYIDAENDTPVLDIKPYHLYERVNDCKVPEWCAHWPSSSEESANFNWEGEFNF